MKFGSILDMGNGRYRCRWSDITGKRRSHYVHGTYHDAELFLMQQEINKYGHDEQVTYGTYWKTEILPQIETLQQKTQHEYKRLWKKHLEKPLEHRIIASTNRKFVQSVIDTIQAPSEQRKACVLWKKICNMSIADGIIQCNPVQKIATKKIERKKKQMLSKDEVFPFLQQFEKTSYYSLIYFVVIIWLSLFFAQYFTHKKGTVSRPPFFILLITKQIP